MFGPPLMDFYAVYTVLIFRKIYWIASSLLPSHRSGAGQFSKGVKQNDSPLLLQPRTPPHILHGNGCPPTQTHTIFTAQLALLRTLGLDLLGLKVKE